MPLPAKLRPGCFIMNNLGNWLPNEKEFGPDESEYVPGISEDMWKKLLKDNSVFTDNALIVMKCILDYGGEAACVDLAEAYGRTKNFYNLISSQLAKRVHDETGCKLYVGTGDRFAGDERLWPVLYTGKYTENHSKFIYRLRRELKTALIRMIVKDVDFK